MGVNLAGSLAVHTFRGAGGGVVFACRGLRWLIRQSMRPFQGVPDERACKEITDGRAGPHAPGPVGTGCHAGGLLVVPMPPRVHHGTRVGCGGGCQGTAGGIRSPARTAARQPGLSALPSGRAVCPGHEGIAEPAGDRWRHPPRLAAATRSRCTDAAGYLSGARLAPGSLTWPSFRAIRSIPAPSTLVTASRPLVLSRACFFADIFACGQES